jgi:putative peptidoglycan lipid II flippase
MTLLVPLSVWMVLIAEPTIRLVFQQGRFGVSDTANTARLLQVLLICVSCWGYQQVLARAFYARLDTLTPAVLGTCVTILMIPVYYLLTVRVGVLGVACASTASLFFYSAAMTSWWKARSGTAAFSGLLSGTAKVLVLAVISALPAWAAGKTNPFDPRFSPYLAAFCEIILSGLGFGITFALLSGYFIPDLARPFLDRLGPVGRRLLRYEAAADE